MTTASGLTVGLRGPRPADDHYALSTMARGVRQSRTYRRLSESDFAPIGEELDLRWRDPDLVRVVACVPDEEDQILGFVVGRERMLTYLHVRSSIRRLGLGRLLASVLGIRSGVPSVAEFDTYDLSRIRPIWATDPDTGERYERFPTGLLSNANWDLTLVPWTPPTIVTL